NGESTMGTTQTSGATALLSDNSEQLLCQAGALDYVRRWCRGVLKSWSGTTRAKVAAIVVSRWEDRAKRGWQTEQRFLPPFAELLNGRRRLAPPKALEPQARFRPSPQPDPRVADAATAFSEPVQVLLSQADPQQTLIHNPLLSWLSAAGKGRWETFLHVCRCLGLGRDGREAGRIMRRLVLLGH